MSSKTNKFSHEGSENVIHEGLIAAGALVRPKGVNLNCSDPGASGSLFCVYLFPLPESNDTLLEDRF